LPVLLVEVSEEIYALPLRAILETSRFADDSAVMRVALSNMLQSSPLVRVCGTAKDGFETVEKTKLLRPDVVTLDVDMPRMDGIEALKRIMGECPCPVIMVSRFTREGAEVTVEALTAGAFDYLPKEDLQNNEDLARLQRNLLEKVEAAAHSSLAGNGGLLFSPPPILALREKAQVIPKIAVIGTSTGGPRALQEIIPELPEKLPIPVVIVQHMPRGFTAPLAKRLDSISKMNVCEASESQLEAGTVYIAPAGRHMTLYGSAPNTWISLSDEPADTMHKPSVDVTMCSVAQVFGRHALGVILTGMESDGAKGVQAIHSAGGITLGQNEATCAVYGMPRSCAESGVLQRVVPLGQVPKIIAEAVHFIG
jgi:two-component system, chemotaxis family, protein-glutamate methylesterase/glutaminase